MSEQLVYGSTTRNLRGEFDEYAGSNGVLTDTSHIRTILNKIGLYPTQSQVNEVVHVSCVSAGRSPVDHITFGEFCILVNELRYSYDNSPPVPDSRARQQQFIRQQLEVRRLSRRFSGSAANFEVFLGGSCNPTTWRADIAIPYLKEKGITFYNPQVSNWVPDLMEIEDQAKQTAELLFFVIDNQTRSTASMVEASYLAGCGRQLILIIKQFEDKDNVVIAGETLSSTEVEDLERSHTYLIDLVERQCIPVFKDIHTALKCTAKVLKENMQVSELTIEDGAQPIKYPHVRVAHQIFKIRDAFKAYDSTRSGKLDINDVRLAYKTITNEELHLSEDSGNQDKLYTFEEFCCLIAEFKYKKKSLWQRIMNNISKFPFRIFDWLRGANQMEALGMDSQCKDVFLGGTCGQSTWRKDKAIPFFKKKGITYYNPQLEEWTTHYIPLEAAVKDKCKVLLYVITGDTRGVTSMIEVGHYIGQGCNIVLCIQDIKQGATIEGEKLTEYAVKDYNRAREYLSDLANRDGVPVCDNIDDALKCVEEKLTKKRSQQS